MPLNLCGATRATVFIAWTPVWEQRRGGPRDSSPRRGRGAAGVGIHKCDWTPCKTILAAYPLVEDVHSDAQHPLLITLMPRPWSPPKQVVGYSCGKNNRSNQQRHRTISAAQTYASIANEVQC